MFMNRNLTDKITCIGWKGPRYSGV